MVGLTQAELAEQARLSARGIADLERGARRSPRADTVGRLVEALHLDRGQREALLLSRRRAPRFDDAPGTNSEHPITAVRLTNLPAALTSFVGREQEIEDIRRELTVARLVTLVGTGGCGKTRLALEVAGASLPVFEDGVWLVDLAPITDPMLVPVTVLTTLGLREQSGRSTVETLVEHLQSQRQLLVLDNCEHLVDACAQFVITLLRAAARVRILSTSREPLAVPGERPYRVQSLAAPGPEDTLTVEHIATSPAVQLLLDRAHLVRPEFMLSAATAPAIASICHHLDGLPLALEFAAARLRTLSPQQVAARLDDRFRLLVGGDRTALPRQRTLAATLDWSFDLLSSVEQATLLRLSVFTGGWTLEAAEAVAGGGPIGADDVLDLLTSLIDKSLVLVEPEGQTGEEPRYRLLETVREYAAQQLMQRGESAAIRGQHATYYTGLAENAELHVSFMRPGRGEAVWLSRLEMDHNNLRTALSWYMECGQPERGLRLAVALFGFWQARGYHSESRRWLELLLAAAPEAPPSLRAAALDWAGMAAHWQGDLTRGRSLYEASLAVARQTADPSSVASALAGLGVLAWEEGDERASSEFLDEGIALARQSGDTAQLSRLLRDKSHAPRVQGRYTEAQAYLEESVALARAVQHHNFVARGLSLLGRVAYLQGDYDVARARFRESLSMRHHRGRFTSDCFEGIAAVLGAHGHAERAARLFGAAEAVRRQTGVVRYAGERAAYDQDVVVVRRQLGEAAGAAAWAEGRKMSFDEAIAYALEEVTC